MNNIGNPFVECTSRDMSFEEVFQYWCDPFSCYRIEYDTLRTSQTPIIIEGPRGSGKTMILKYISYFCQKELLRSKNIESSQSEMLNYIRNTGSLGVYFRYKDDFGSLFRFLNCSQSAKDSLFLYYFEMYIIDEIMYIILDLYSNKQLSDESIAVFVNKMNELFSENSKTLADVQRFIEERVRRLDQWVRRSRYIDNAEEKLLAFIDNYDYIEKVCTSIAQSIEDLKNVRFLIIIDEYENAGDYQRLLNTLLKQVEHKSSISYRIGVRPQGINTLETNIGKESLQKDRDFLLFELQTNETTKYKQFLEKVAERRLKSVPFFEENNITSIKDLLGAREILNEEALSIVKGSQKHFDLVRKGNNAITEDEINMIRYDSNPLIEMLNIVWVLRGVSPEKVSIAMNGFLRGYYKSKEETDKIQLAKKYKLDYSDKYRFQLLSILLGIYSQNKSYYSFNTFAYMSTGSVNDFISLCRNVFYLLDEGYYENISKNVRIPVKIQAKGAEITAIEQLDKIRMSNDNGLEMYSFAMNMGGLFKSFHRDKYAKYPETNQFAFQNEIEINSRPLLMEVLKHLIKWGVIIRKSRIQSISIGRRKGRLYYLNRMLCPIFGISYRTRGGYNFVISTQLFEQLLKGELEADKILAWRDKRTKEIEEKKLNDNNQITIYEVMQYE